jgi:hypothetical protein
MPQRHDGQSILSLLALEILLYFNWWYSMLYIFANIIVFAYKGTWVAPFQKIPSLFLSALDPTIQVSTCPTHQLLWDGKSLSFSCTPSLK